MKVGYVRVSTAEQHTDRQDAMMRELGIEKVFTDKASGKDANRPQLKAMLDFVREGDMVVVESYSRLARSTRDLLAIVDTLTGKGVGFQSIHEAVSTDTPQGRLFLVLFSGLAQFERECTLQRQAEGIAEAKKRGVYKGRKPLEIDAAKFKSLYADWKADKITAAAAYRKLGVSSSSFYRRVREHEGSMV